MNPSGVQQFLWRVNQRQKIVSLARQGRRFLLVALGLFAAALVISRCLGCLHGWFTLVSLAIFSLVTLVLAGIFHRRTGITDAARLADTHLGTSDLFLTAAMIDRSLGAYQALVLQAAEQRAGTARPQSIVPYAWQRDVLKLGAALAVVCLAVYALPQWDPFGLHQREQKLADQHKLVRDISKATEVRAALLEEKRAGEQTDAVKAAVAGLEKAFQEAKPNEQAATLARLNEQQKILGQLWKQTSEEKLQNAMNLPPPTQSFGLADPTKMEQMRNDLQKGDVASASKELAEIKQQAEELARTQDPVQREKLRQELMDRLQNLKDTMAQQMNSQAMDSALQRALEQLALSNTPELSSEALKGLSDSLQLSQQELQQLAQAMADMKNLDEALKALQMAKALHNMKPLDGADYAKLGDLAAYAAFCAGQCKSLTPGQGLGQGVGIGPRPHGNENSTTGYHAEKDISQPQPGRMLMEWKTREVSEAGPAREQYLQAVQDIRQQASEAVVQEQIPPGYQAAIKRYFDTLHNDSSANPKP